MNRRYHRVILWTISRKWRVFPRLKASKRVKKCILIPGWNTNVEQWCKLQAVLHSHYFSFCCEEPILRPDLQTLVVLSEFDGTRPEKPGFSIRICCINSTPIGVSFLPSFYAPQLGSFVCFDWLGWWTFLKRRRSMVCSPRKSLGTHDWWCIGAGTKNTGWGNGWSSD